MCGLALWACRLSAFSSFFWEAMQLSGSKQDDFSRTKAFYPLKGKWTNRCQNLWHLQNENTLFSSFEDADSAHSDARLLFWKAQLWGVVCYLYEWQHWNIEIFAILKRPGWLRCFLNNRGSSQMPLQCQITAACRSLLKLGWGYTCVRSAGKLWWWMDCTKRTRVHVEVEAVIPLPVVDKGIQTKRKRTIRGIHREN